MRSCAICLLSEGKNYPISFDEKGVCNYCNDYFQKVKTLGDKENRKKVLKSKLEEIREYGKNKKYPCILGVSGGVDSSYLAYWLTQQQIKPLLVHFDNGWNSELATKNIELLCDKLNLDLYTYVMDWPEFRELQKAYFRADVVDIEALTDHGIMGTIYMMAKKYKIKYIISGFNISTESVMPKGWTHPKDDFRNIQDIVKKHGKTKIKKFPHVTFFQKILHHFYYKFEKVNILDYIDYNKEKAKEILKNEIGWRDYGGKHYESLFTRFYQSYILPKKFNIDKRYAHISNLLCSGQITKEEALKELEKPLYDENTIKQEIDIVLKKLEFSKEEFENYMKRPPRSHSEFATEKAYWDTYFKVIKILKSILPFHRK